jgi:WD40 repeat protein
VWEASTGEVIAAPFTGHTDGIVSVVFSPDGQCIASASEDRTIRVWNSATGEAIACPLTGHMGGVVRVAFSPDGRYIASASKDHTIRLWDAQTGAVARLSPEYTKSVDPVVLSPDLQRIGTSQDHAVSTKKARMEDVEKVDFMNKLLVNDDGWMCGEEGELLMWIPQVHRPYFHRSNTVWIAGRYETWLELTNFVHGSDWATVCHDI